MTALTKVEKFETNVFDEQQVLLLKNTICKGSSDEELKFFIYACTKTGLDPFSRQIYSVPRGGQRVIQTSVDGFRLIAERTGRYAPGREPTFVYDKNGVLFSATSYVKKQTKDGTWHEVSASAMMSEYDGKNNFWKKMPHLMLAKCAECLALRKAFPAEMSGLYGQEEMQQADVIVVKNEMPVEKLSTQQVIELQAILNDCSKEYQDQVKSFLPKKYKCDLLDDVPLEEFQKLRIAFETKAKEYQKQLAEAEMSNVNQVQE